eukprot:sb/3465162/
MFTQLLTTAAALLLLGGQAHAESITHATLINSKDQFGVSWGTLVVTVQGDDGNLTTGMVCDDGMTNTTADFLCKAAGFDSMKQWSGIRRSPLEYRLSPSSWSTQFDRRFALDDLRCGPGAIGLDGCTHVNPVGGHNCGYFEGMVLRCSKRMDLKGMHVQLLENKGIISSWGTVVLTGHHDRGLVCADGVNVTTAEVLCHEAGYDHMVEYKAAKNVNSGSRLDCDTMQHWDIGAHVIVEDLNCTSKSTELGNCSAAYASGGCDADDALWLSCKTRPEWELTNLTMAYNEAGNHSPHSEGHGGRYGTVVVTVKNTITGEERTGLTPYTSSSYTRSSMCYMTGYANRYPTYRPTGQINENSNTKLTCGYILENEMEFVISSLWCPGYNTPLSGCEFVMANDGYSPGNNKAMWISC